MPLPVDIYALYALYTHYIRVIHIINALDTRTVESEKSCVSYDVYKMTCQLHLIEDVCNEEVPTA